MPDHRRWYVNGTLPHFDSAEVTQAITFRLADSLPRDVTVRISREAEAPSQDDAVQARERLV